MLFAPGVKAWRLAKYGKEFATVLGTQPIKKLRAHTAVPAIAIFQGETRTIVAVRELCATGPGPQLGKRGVVCHRLFFIGCRFVFDGNGCRIGKLGQ